MSGTDSSLRCEAPVREPVRSLRLEAEALRPRETPHQVEQIGDDRLTFRVVGMADEACVERRDIDGVETTNHDDAAAQVPGPRVAAPQSLRRHTGTPIFSPTSEHRGLGWSVSTHAKPIRPIAIERHKRPIRE